MATNVVHGTAYAEGRHAKKPELRSDQCQVLSPRVVKAIQASAEVKTNRSIYAHSVRVFDGTSAGLAEALGLTAVVKVEGEPDDSSVCGVNQRPHDGVLR